VPDPAVAEIISDHSFHLSTSSRLLLSTAPSYTSTSSMKMKELRLTPKTLAVFSDPLQATSSALPPLSWRASNSPSLRKGIPMEDGKMVLRLRTVLLVSEVVLVRLVRFVSSTLCTV
jgi:hypothetical protein